MKYARGPVFFNILKAHRKLRVHLSDSLCDECQVDGHANEISKLTTSGWAS